VNNAFKHAETVTVEWLHRRRRKLLKTICCTTKQQRDDLLHACRKKLNQLQLPGCTIRYVQPAREQHRDWRDKEDRDGSTSVETGIQ